MDKRHSDKSLIFGLYKEFTNTAAAAPAGAVKYAADTQTLYAHRAVSVLENFNTEEAEAAEKNKFPIDRKHFEPLMQDTVRYILVKNVPVRQGEEIVLYESNGLAPTGRYITKRVAHVETFLDAAGLKDGYYILSW